MEKQGLRITAATLAPFFLFISVLTFGLWFSVFRGGAVSNVITSTMSDSRVQSGFGVEFADSLLNSADATTRTAMEVHKPELQSALAKKLGTKESQDKVAGLATQVFDALMNGSATTTLDIRPILTDAIDAINTVPGIPQVTPDLISDVEPKVLGSESDPLPDLGAVKSAVTALGIVSLLLGLLFTFFIWRESKTRFRGVGIPLVSVGAFWMLVTFPAPGIISAGSEMGLQRDIIKAASTAVLSGPRTLALIFFVVGIALLGTHFYRSRQPKVESA